MIDLAKERVLDESEELRGKISKIEVFIKKDAIGNISQAQVYLLLVQLDAMKVYDRILTTRLAIWND